MSKSRLKIWPVRAYLVDSAEGLARGLMRCSLTGNSKQRKRGIRLLRREGFTTLHDGGAGRIMAIPK